MECTLIQLLGQFLYTVCVSDSNSFFHIWILLSNHFLVKAQFSSLMNLLLLLKSIGHKSKGLFLNSKFHFTDPHVHPYTITTQHSLL